MNEINTDVFTFLNNKNDDTQISSTDNEIKDTSDSESNDKDLPF